MVGTLNSQKISGCVPLYNVTMKIALVTISLLMLLTGIDAGVQPQKNFDLQRVRTLALCFWRRAFICRTVSGLVSKLEKGEQAGVVLELNSWIYEVCLRCCFKG